MKSNPNPNPTRYEVGYKFEVLPVYQEPGFTCITRIPGIGGS